MEEHAARSDANLVENPLEEGEVLEMTSASREVVIRTCSGRTVKLTRYPDFDYDFHCLINKNFASDSVPIKSEKIPILFYLLNSCSDLSDLSFCIFDSHCAHVSRESRQAQMSKRKQSLEKVQAAGENASFLEGQCLDYAFITKESEAPFMLNTDAGTFVLAHDSTTYEGYLASSNSPLNPRFKALNDYDITLPKVDDEVPGGDAFSNYQNFGFSS